MRGGEHVLEVLCELYPDAPVYTLLWIRGSLSPSIEERRIHTSPLQRMPWSRTHYRWYLPFFPFFIRSFDLSSYDLVLSTSHCAAKGVTVGDDALHISYIHAPMRYAWDKYFDYFSGDDGLGGPKWIINLILNRLRKWDYTTSARVDHYIANSDNIARKIKAFYSRDADVIHPPVDCDRFTVGDGKGEYYLYVGAFVPYKKVEIAIEACRRLEKTLIIVGGGQRERIVKDLADQSRWIQFVGWKSPEELSSYYRNCRALLFPPDEDFGITPLEAMASGRPVVAYGRGGVLETIAAGIEIRDLENPVRVLGGVLFPEQSVESMIDGIKLLETEEFDSDLLRQRAEMFDRGLFKEKIKETIAKKLSEREPCNKRS
jgi:glycosyltransferase involved in cell wall biosynthesis